MFHILTPWLQFWSFSCSDLHAQKCQPTTRQLSPDSCDYCLYKYTFVSLHRMRKPSNGAALTTLCLIKITSDLFMLFNKTEDVWVVKLLISAPECRVPCEAVVTFGLVQKGSLPVNWGNGWFMWTMAALKNGIIKEKTSFCFPSHQAVGYYCRSRGSVHNIIHIERALWRMKLHTLQCVHNYY